MRRKSNTWVALVALIPLLVLVVCTCTGCGGNTAEAEDTTGERFEVETVGESFGGQVAIITDTETGVQYLWVKSGYAGGLTKLEDADPDV